MIAARAFTFLWPLMLSLLVVVPVLVFFYLRLLSRRSEASRRYASLAATNAVDPAAVSASSGKPGAMAALRRHAPAILMLLGITAMIVAVARPQAVIMLPSRLDAIMLAMDTSGSMRATDIKPNRLVAAQNAAKAFVANQPGQVRIGIVTVAATASVVQSPTDNRDDITKAIDRVQMQPGTALGSGLVISLITLLPESGIDAEKIITGRNASTTAWTRDPARQTEIDNFKPVPPRLQRQHCHRAAVRWPEQHRTGTAGSGEAGRRARRARLYRRRRHQGGHHAHRRRLVDAGAPG